MTMIAVFIVHCASKAALRFPLLLNYRKLSELTREDPHLVVVVFMAGLRLADIKSSISFSLTCVCMLA